MSRCEKCFSFYPPQYMREIEGAEDSDKQCIYCERDKDHVMIIKDDGSEEKYTKKQCVSDYKQFLKKLKTTPDIAKKLAKLK